MIAGREPGFGLYVHWPFCRSKCPYCDFNSHVRAAVDHGRWRAALLRELEHYGAATEGRRLTSIFFGGGTPSLMEPETVARRDRAGAPHLAGRSPISKSRWKPIRPRSKRRTSPPFAMPASTGCRWACSPCDEADLNFLGRQHSAGEARPAIELARRYFGRFTFDLIYARPGQTVAAWRDELREALALAGNHLSVYQLTIEPETAFASAVRRGDFAVPDEDMAAALYEATQEALAEAGLPAYEISNHARPGEESRHNLTYWRYGDYVGIGPGAHGRLTLDGVRYATRASTGRPKPGWRWSNRKATQRGSGMWWMPRRGARRC